MLKPEQVPDEAWYIVAEPLARACGCNQPHKHSTDAKEFIAAALSAWPGVRMMVDIDTGDDAAIKLPLPQDGGDD